MIRCFDVSVVIVISRVDVVSMHLSSRIQIKGLQIGSRHEANTVTASRRRISRIEKHRVRDTSRGVAGR
jgi:hypothetical protein